MNEVTSELSLMATPIFSWLQRNGTSLTEDQKRCFSAFLEVLTAELEKGGLCVEVAKEPVESLLSVEKLFTPISQVKATKKLPLFFWEPLEANRLRIYMRRFYECEADLALRLSRFFEKDWTGNGNVDEAFVRAREIGLASIHPELCEIVFRKGLTVLYGGPGTGKTTQLTFILESLLSANPNLKVALAAPTGKASSRMKLAVVDAIKGNQERFKALADKNKQVDFEGLPAATIHRWLSNVQENGEKPSLEKPLDCDLFVVDEASMVDIELARRLFTVLNPERTRVILMGDAYQLQAVGPGSFFGDLCDFGSEGTHRFAYGLKITHRFDPTSPVGLLAASIKREMLQGAKGEEDEVASALRAPECLDPLPIDRPLQKEKDVVSAVKSWLTPYMTAYAKALQDGDQERIWAKLTDFRMLSATRRGSMGVEKLNEIACEMLREALGKDYTEDSGLPIIVQANDADRGVFNGDIGVILPRKAGTQSIGRVVFGDILDAEKRPLVVPLGVLPAYETAFAITVHKSQGSEFHHVALFLPEEAENPLTTSELYYTGVTRISDRKNKEHAIEEYGTLSIFSSPEVEEKAKKTRPARASGLVSRLNEYDFQS